MSGKAKIWVEDNYPDLPDGPFKAMMIMAYGAGLDEGLKEAQEILTETAKEFRIYT